MRGNNNNNTTRRGRAGRNQPILVSDVQAASMPVGIINTQAIASVTAASTTQFAPVATDIPTRQLQQFSN